MKRAISLFTCLALLPFLTGAAFPFSFWKAAGGGGSPPSFSSLMGQFSDAGSETTDVLTCATSGATIGQFIVVGIACKVDALSITSLTDNGSGGSNTYTAQGPSTPSAGFASGATSGNIIRLYWYTAPVTHTLTTSSTITITWASGTSHGVNFFAIVASNATTIDATPAFATTNTNPSVSCTASSANTLAIGMFADVFPDTLTAIGGSGTWNNISGSPSTSPKVWYHQQAFSSSGSKTYSGTMNDPTNWLVDGIILVK